MTLGRDGGDETPATRRRAAQTTCSSAFRAAHAAAPGSDRPGTPCAGACEGKGADLISPDDRGRDRWRRLACRRPPDSRGTLLARPAYGRAVAQQPHGQRRVRRPEPADSRPVGLPRHRRVGPRTQYRRIDRRAARLPRPRPRGHRVEPARRGARRLLPLERRSGRGAGRAGARNRPCGGRRRANMARPRVAALAALGFGGVRLAGPPASRFRRPRRARHRRRRPARHGRLPGLVLFRAG